MSLTILQRKLVNRVRKNPDAFGLRYKDYGKSTDFTVYSDEEISEMIAGVYTSSRQLCVDGDYFINMNDVVQAGCTLGNVSFFKKKDDRYPIIFTAETMPLMKAFYAKNYFLVTEKEVAGTHVHEITRFLYKTKAISKGKGQYLKLFRINNKSLSLQKFNDGTFPLDLYVPIKKGINQLFFGDDSKISDFVVGTKDPKGI